jgi:hypothetical protein
MYPEYQNCSIKYIKDLNEDCFTCPLLPGVNVYCLNISSRGNLKPYNLENPIQLGFDEITIKDLRIRYGDKK